jgi:RNA polymerase sigma factor (sigma-70 family)
MKSPSICIIPLKNCYFTHVNRESFDHITDQELLDRFYEDHDNEWLGILLKRYTLLLLGVCMKYLKNEEDARDSVQQLFLKAITELHKYKVDFFKSWIYMVARNHCLMKLRDRHGKIPIEIRESMALPAGDPENEDYRAKDLLLEEMGRALEQLSPEQKLCVTLFYLKKISYQDISSQTGFTLMQVKSHIQNGKRNLKILLDKKIPKNS